MNRFSFVILTTLALAVTTACSDDQKVAPRTLRGSFGPIVEATWGARVQKALQDADINTTQSCARRIEMKNGNVVSIVVAILIGESCKGAVQPEAGDVVATFMTTQSGSKYILYSETYGPQYSMGEMNENGSSVELTDLCTGNYAACEFHSDESGYITEIELY